LKRDEDACADLVRASAVMVGTIIWRATGDGQVVDDLAQETFLRVFRALRFFDGKAKLSTWIYTIAHRVAIDYLRQRGRLRETALDDEAYGLIDIPASGPTPEAAFAREEMASVVREELEALPDKYRLPMLYATIDGMDYETIGQVLGVQPGTVKTLVFRGKRMLKARVSEALAGRCVL
jgi:RNA polymerase sigma-70 factor (ECF subfamily)